MGSEVYFYAIAGSFAGPDAELLPYIIDDVITAADHAGACLAYFKHVFAYGLQVVHAVKSSNLIHFYRRYIEQGSYIVHHRYIQPVAKLLLCQVEYGQ